MKQYIIRADVVGGNDRSQILDDKEKAQSIFNEILQSKYKDYVDIGFVFQEQEIFDWCGPVTNVTLTEFETNDVDLI